jgi:hypothetical protein
MLMFIVPDDGRRFLVIDSSCDDPDCTAIHLTFVEIDERHQRVEGVRPFFVSIDADTWKVIPGDGLTSAKRRLVKPFLADLGEGDRAFLRARYDSDKGQARRVRSHTLSPGDVRSGMLVSYANIATGGQSVHYGGDLIGLSFDYEGTTYVIEDLYCPNPDCDCRKATLHFSQVNKAAEMASLEHGFTATWYFSGRTKVEETPGCTKKAAREVLAAWLNHHPDLPDLFRDRYRQIMDIGRRSLAGTPIHRTDGLKPAQPLPRSERKIGRNAPCPCGSGLKYKRCCGRNG